jgi:hypothetical protein
MISSLVILILLVIVISGAAAEPRIGIRIKVTSRTKNKVSA